jgi:hypothetical protein
MPVAEGFMRDVSFSDQRVLTDEDFLSGVKLPGSAGVALRAAVARGDRSAWARSIAEHFRSRMAPRWPFYMHGTAWMEINGRGDTLEKADGLLRREFRNSWPPFAAASFATPQGSVDWDAFGRAMGTSMGRNTFVPELTTAFALTGKLEYLRAVRELLFAFADARPFVLEEGFHEDHDRYFGGPANPTLNVLARSLRWIDLMHSGALHTDVFSDDDVFRLVKQLWFYAMQYYRFVGDPMRRDNHHLCDHGKAAFVFGVAFPEFTIAKEMVAQGRETIAFHFANNVLPDGGYAEHCTKYQYHILYTYCFVHALAKANGIALLAPKQVRQLERWIEFNARACKPDGIIVEFGDEFGGSLAHLFCTMAAPVMTPRIAAMSRALGYEPGKLAYETPQALARRFRRWSPGTPPRVGLSPWFSHPREPRKPVRTALPTPASVQYPHGGFTFFRDSWTPHADFLAVAHYTDSLPHSHTHWDMMSFVLHSGGHTLIGDPATWLYTDPRKVDRESRGYSYSVDAHNCLVMDDDTLKPFKALGHPCCWGGYPPKHGLGLFAAGGPIEVSEMWHDAYAPTRHRRFVVRIDGVGFAFVDLLSRSGLDLRPHQYSQLVHFSGGVALSTASPEAGASLSASLAEASCTIVPGAETCSSWRTWRDERLRGLYGVAADASGNGPWVAELTRRQQGPSVFSTFLLTRGAGTARYLGCTAAKEGYRQHEGISANAIDLGPPGRLLLASCPYGAALESTELSTDAELAVVLLDRRGARKAWAMARGSRLAVGGRMLVRGRKREWLQG